jgi:beta-lactamase superfamily II metal-dependent hydrolase
VQAIWHNVFKDQTQDNTGEIEEVLVAAMKIVNMNPDATGQDWTAQAEAYNELVTSIKEGLLLSRRIGPDQLGLEVNAPAQGKLIFVSDPPPQIPLGGLKFYTIGPFKAELEKLRQEWNAWLQSHQEAIRQIREEPDPLDLPMEEGEMLLSSLRALAQELGQRNLVTTPNLASLMFLVEEDDTRVLLTGDGHFEDILKGLEAQGKLDDQGRLHVDVLKIQHHGSEHNINKAFCQAVTADHYIFCGNGAHQNPDLIVLDTLIKARLEADTPPADGPFKLWFNSSVEVTEPNYKDHMQAVETLVSQVARRNRGKIYYRFLTQGSKLSFSL